MKKNVSLVIVALLIFTLGYLSNDILEKKVPSRGYNTLKRQQNNFHQRICDSLDLTNNQKLKIDRLYINNKKEMTPLIKKLYKEKNTYLEMIEKDAQQSDLAEQRGKIRYLHTKINLTRNEHRKKFRELLNKEQKIKFDKIEKELKIKYRNYRNHNIK